MKLIRTIILAIVLALGAAGVIFLNSYQPPLELAYSLITEKNDYDKAIRLLDEIISNKPVDAAAAYDLRALAYEGKKDLLQAVADYNKVQELNPHFGPEPYLRIAKLYEQLGNMPLVLATYEKAVKAYPSRSDLYFRLFKLYLDQNQLTEARNNLILAVKVADDDNKPAVLIEAVAFYQRKNLEPESLTSFPEVLEFDHQNDQRATDQAVLYLKYKNYDDAISTLDQIIANKDMTMAPRAYNLLAEAYEGRADFARAVLSYSEALRVDPGLCPAYAGKSKALVVMGRPQEAQAVAQEGVKRGCEIK